MCRRHPWAPSLSESRPPSSTWSAPATRPVCVCVCARAREREREREREIERCVCMCICVYLCVSVYVAGADLFTEAILITELATGVPNVCLMCRDRPLYGGNPHHRGRNRWPPPPHVPRDSPCRRHRRCRWDPRPRLTAPFLKSPEQKIKTERSVVWSLNLLTN
jgi:hypothetical protein